MSRRACEMVGWDYQLLGATDPVVTSNLRWLAGYRHPRYLVAEIAARLRGVVGEPVALIDAARDPIATLPDEIGACGRWSGRSAAGRGSRSLPTYFATSTSPSSPSGSRKKRLRTAPKSLYWAAAVDVHDHLIGEFAAHRHGHRQRGLEEIGAHVVMGTAPRIKRG